MNLKVVILYTTIFKTISLGQDTQDEKQEVYLKSSRVYVNNLPTFQIYYNLKGQRKVVNQNHISPWSPWTTCNSKCIKRRESLCIIKSECDHMKYIQERRCSTCYRYHNSTNAYKTHRNTGSLKANILQKAESVTDKFSPQNSSLKKSSDSLATSTFNILHNDNETVLTNAEFSLNSTTENPTQIQKIVENYKRLNIKRSASMKKSHIIRRVLNDDMPNYEDYDSVQNSDEIVQSESFDSFEDHDNQSSNHISSTKEMAISSKSIPKKKRVYSKWSRWSKCSNKCTTKRHKICQLQEQCGRDIIREVAYCYTEGSLCQHWLVGGAPKVFGEKLNIASYQQSVKSQSDKTDNAYLVKITKGYRGPEYMPMRLTCGVSPLANYRKNVYDMMKIIGGKAVRRGEWPWQVAIFNRFKEPFCGGTLIAPQWVLTAAHCVRKVLYIRIGEHNLYYDDGTEMEVKILNSFKHPNFDKKTVENDIALLKLPVKINTSTWVGFSCLPRPFQPLPKNKFCTVIGWGKRSNRDAVGSNVLQQATVPIVSMDNCRSVYQDYTITKNMFCAGHKRGRVDTCAGDSGGPLLCRDTTTPNHPWTIYGVTSFGDGCAKRNKFGIYTKVPNYVDWIWSVINCNGNCQLHHVSRKND